MLSVWWDLKGIVHFELLPKNRSINSNVYCRQLMKLDKEIKEKRPELATREEVMLYPPYGPDLAPSDYHLFRSLQNHLDGKTFDSDEVVRNELIHFFASKNQTFYESGIMKLTERWQKVIEQNGQ